MSVTYETVSIPAGEAFSSSVDCKSRQPVRIVMPDDWTTGPSGGIITFQISSDEAVWFDIFRINGEPISVIVKPKTTLMFSRELGFDKLQDYFRVRAGDPERPALQSAQRDFIFAIETV